MSHRVLLALGSNLGNKELNIRTAIRSLARAGVTVDGSAKLYESAAEYVTAQPSFFNTAVSGTTDREPLALLAELKSIESNQGRDLNAPRRGPRTIDVDIIFYDDLVLNAERLNIPHVQCHERSFVLEPACDLVPDYVHPVLSQTPRDLLAALKQPPLPALYNLGGGAPLLAIGGRTVIMGVLNTTPDSFSDGGLSTSLSGAVARAKAMLAEGADIIDVGGESTRPGSAPVPLEVELQRTVPLIERLRAEGVTCPISIDTTKAEVARAAVRAGAGLINDVSGGTFDPRMFATAAEEGASVCIMHMGGTSTATMQQGISYPGDDVVAAVNGFLARQVAAAMRAGVPRWNIIVDPGVGFGKEVRHNLDLIRRVPELRGHGCAVLMGTSRKGFIGKITGRDKANERVMGTAATYCAAIAGGADIIRVHDVAAMREVAAMCDAIYRPRDPAHVCGTNRGQPSNAAGQ